MVNMSAKFDEEAHVGFSWSQAYFHTKIMSIVYWTLTSKINSVHSLTMAQYAKFDEEAHTG